MTSPLPDPTQPYLERYPELGGPVERIPLIRMPFTIGRAETVDHTIYSNKVSKEHAAIEAVGDRFSVRDLGSTNGTFVNGQRVVEQFLSDGDIVHVAHVEFCFRQPSKPVRIAGTSGVRLVERTELLLATEPDSIIRGTRLLREMIRTEAVEVLYQPIVDLQTRTVMGYEALGRGAHTDLSSSPLILLRLAEQCGLVVELSQLFARRAVANSHTLPAGAKVFVNIHAQELAAPGFLDGLAGLRALAPADRPIVIEIAESSVTDVSAMAENKAAFRTLGLEFAYDDFGAGQARLMELVDVPPDYLKIDKLIIQGLDEASARQDIVGALLGAVRGLGVQVIAEGIETESVAATCHDLGCHLGQGYLFGRPV